MSKPHDNESLTKLLQAIDDADLKTVKALTNSHTHDSDSVIHSLNIALSAKKTDIEVFKTVLNSFSTSKRRELQPHLNACLQLVIIHGLSLDHTKALIDIGADPSDNFGVAFILPITYRRKDILDFYTNNTDISHRSYKEQNQFIIDLISYAFSYCTVKEVEDLIDSPLVKSGNFDSKELFSVALTLNTPDDDLLDALAKKLELDIEPDALFYIHTAINGVNLKTPLEFLERYNVDITPLLPEVLNAILVSKHSAKFNHLAVFIEKYDLPTETLVGDEKTPLISLLAKNGELAPIKAYIKRGFDINEKDKDGKAPIDHTLLSMKAGHFTDLGQKRILTEYINGKLDLNTGDTQNNLNIYAFAAKHELKGVNDILTIFEDISTSTIRSTVQDNTSFADLSSMQGTITTIPVQNKANELSFDLSFNALSHAICKGQYDAILSVVQKSKDDYLSYDQINIFNSGHPIPDQAKESILFKTGKIPKLFSAAIWRNNVQEMSKFYNTLPDRLQQQAKQAYTNMKNEMTLLQAKTNKPQIKRRGPRR